MIPTTTVNTFRISVPLTCKTISFALDEQLIIIVEDLFFGGLVTTGTLLSWSILFLVLNPEVQVKLRREILGKMKNPTDDMQAIELKKYNSLQQPVQCTLLRDFESMIFSEYRTLKQPFWKFCVWEILLRFHFHGVRHKM